MALDIIVQVVTIVGAIAALFSFAVLRPLNTAIARLEKTIETLGAQIEKAEERRHELEIRLAEVDQRAKSAHRRLDTFADFCQKTHSGTMPADVYAAIARKPGRDEA